MGAFVANLLLALSWMFMIGGVNLPNLVVGYVLGFVILRFAAGRKDDRTAGMQSPYFDKVYRSLRLFVYFMAELVKANITMAYYTLSPLAKLRPGILAVPLAENMTDAEITLYANMITLTPGTLTLDVSTDRTRIFVHFMHIEDADEHIAELKNGFERRILEVTRGRRPSGPRPRRRPAADAGADAAGATA